MSIESRTVRPYQIPQKLSCALQDVKLYFGGESFNSGETITLPDRDEYLRTRIELHWASDSQSFDKFKCNILEGAAEGQFDKSALSILVISYSSYLKTVDKVRQVMCSNLNEEPQAFVLASADKRPPSLSSSFHRTTISLYLYLNRSLQQRPLQAWQFGTWLAKEEFYLTRQYSEQLFHPRPLTKEKRQEFMLPNDTMRYLDMDSASLLDAEEIYELDFYVDEIILNELTVRPNSLESRVLQLQLAQDVFSSIIYAASIQREELHGKTWSDLSDSLLGRVINIASRVGMGPQELLDKVPDSPEIVIAHAESAINLLAQTKNLIRGESQ